ncbi:hypothetical protein COLO4_19404 [Corchorus olitorius]|uniref:Uncharacterized protein n=1 Tax=Corchorus olitorius TaxID=93759 RepID=A0A1R3J5I1_9ROSI|nr:hypothetical protein COLO4_19404 [Corchorus olitorius]
MGRIGSSHQRHPFYQRREPPTKPFPRHGLISLLFSFHSSLIPSSSLLLFFLETSPLPSLLKTLDTPHSHPRPQYFHGSYHSIPFFQKLGTILQELESSNLGNFGGDPSLECSDYGEPSIESASNFGVLLRSLPSINLSA